MIGVILAVAALGQCPGGQCSPPTFVFPDATMVQYPHYDLRGGPSQPSAFSVPSFAPSLSYKAVRGQDGITWMRAADEFGEHWVRKSATCPADWKQDQWNLFRDAKGEGSWRMCQEGYELVYVPKDWKGRKFATLESLRAFAKDGPPDHGRGVGDLPKYATTGIKIEKLQQTPPGAYGSYGDLPSGDDGIPVPPDHPDGPKSKIPLSPMLALPLVAAAAGLGLRKFLEIYR